MCFSANTMTKIAMSTQPAKALLLLVMVVACASGARGYTTYVTNQSSRAITGTITTDVTSDFVNRIVYPGTHEAGNYPCNVGDCHNGVHIEIWVEGAGQHNHVDVDADRSIVGYDNADGSGVDIFLAKYGTLIQKDSDVLVTIYLN